MKVLTQQDANKLYKNVFCSLSIQRGKKEPLLQTDHSLRKYVLEAPRIGMEVHTYVNRGQSYYSLAEKIECSGVKCSKTLEEGDKLMMTLPPNSMKVVTYRSSWGSPKPIEIKVHESICHQK